MPMYTGNKIKVKCQWKLKDEAFTLPFQCELYFRVTVEMQLMRGSAFYTRLARNKCGRNERMIKFTIFNT